MKSIATGPPEASFRVPVFHKNAEQMLNRCFGVQQRQLLLVYQRWSPYQQHTARTCQQEVPLRLPRGSLLEHLQQRHRLLLSGHSKALAHPRVLRWHRPRADSTPLLLIWSWQVKSWTALRFRRTYRGVDSDPHCQTTGL